MEDEISRLLASVPVLRCPNGHSGSAIVIRTTEFSYHVSDNGKFLAHEARAFDSNVVSETLACGICNVRFDIPDGYEMRSKKRGGGSEEEDDTESTLDPTVTP